MSQNEEFHFPATLQHDQGISIGHEQREKSPRGQNCNNSSNKKTKQIKAALGCNVVFKIII